MFMAGLMLVLIALALTFNYALFTDPTKLSGLYDVHRYFGPLAFYMDACIHSGQFPFWNPLTYCGMPFAANPQVAALYPPNLLRSALTFSPTPYRTQFGLVVLMGLHMLLAFGGAYLLARAHRISRSGSWAAALAFTFSALMVRRVCEYHFVCTLNWLPLLLLLSKQLLDAPDMRRKLRWGIAAGVVFGMATLGGSFQIVNYMGVALAAYVLLYRMLHPRSGARLRGEIEGGRRDACAAVMLRAWLPDGAALGVVAVVMLLIAGALLFPAMELARYTGRQPGVAVPMYSNLYERLWVGIAQDAIVYPGMRYDAEALRGSGVAALILAVAALFMSRRREVLLFAGVYLVLLDCSFGPPLPVSFLVNKLTPFAPSAYSRAYDLALLPLSLLAGLGVDGLARKPGAWWAALLETMLLTLVGGTLLFLLWTWIHPAHYLGITPWVAAVPGLALAVMVAARVFPRFSGTAVLLLPLLIFLETLSWNVGYVPMMTRLRIPPIPAQTADFPQDNHRQTDAKANRQLFRLRHLINGYDPLNLRQTWEALCDPVLASKYSRLARKESLAENQRTNLLFKRSLWLTRQWVKGGLPGKSSLFPAATTVFLPDAANLTAPQVDAKTLKNSGVSDNVRRQSVMTPSLGASVKAGTKVRKDLRLELPTRLNNGLPGPAGAVHSVLRLGWRSSCPGTIETEFRDRATDQVELGKKISFGASAETEVELPLPDYASMDVSFTVSTMGGTGNMFEITRAELLSDNCDEDGLIKIVSRRANRIDLEVGPLDGPRILAYLDAWYPGWHAYVDDAEVPLLRADDGFKAVEIPLGAHHVVFAFSPVRSQAGIAVSLASLAALAGALLLTMKRGDRKSIDRP
jgi:hypothetical protein